MSDRDDERPGRRRFLTTAPLATAMLTGCATSAARPRTQQSTPVWIDVRDFGAAGDGSTDDHRALAKALAGHPGRKIIVPPGRYRFQDTLEIPDRTHLELLPGATLECGVVHGGNAITIGNSSKLVGTAGTGALIAHETCRISSLVTNAKHDGTQEYGFIEGLSIVARAGAKISTALVDLVALFVNSGIRDCSIAGAYAAPTGLRISGGEKTGFGPVYVDNVWVSACARHNIVITEQKPYRGAASCWLTNVTSEHQGSGSHGLYMKGYGGLYNVSVRNFHYEHGQDVNASTAAIFVDGVPGFSLDGADLLAVPLNHKKGIVITENQANYMCRIRGVQNINGLDPVLEDRLHGQTLHARNVGFYETANPGASTGHVDQVFTHLVRMPGGVATMTKSGPISDADFPPGTPIADGTLAVDTASSKLFVRVGGRWKSVGLG